MTHIEFEREISVIKTDVELLKLKMDSFGGTMTEIKTLLKQHIDGISVSIKYLEEGNKSLEYKKSNREEIQRVENELRVEIKKINDQQVELRIFQAKILTGIAIAVFFLPYILPVLKKLIYPSG